MYQIWAYFIMVTWNTSSDIDMLFNGMTIIFLHHTCHKY